MFEVGEKSISTFFLKALIVAETLKPSAKVNGNHAISTACLMIGRPTPSTVISSKS